MKNLLAALALFGCASALASPAVTLTDANDAAHAVTWTAGPYVIRTAEVGCTPASACDNTTLTVNVSPEVAATHRVVVAISWPAPTQSDFDLLVTQGDNTIASSGSTTDPEIARFDPVNGDYNVHVTPYNPIANSYTALVFLEPLPAPGVTANGPIAGFDTFAPPEDLELEGGEPSIGDNWTTGTAVIGNAETAAFINFDDTTTPVTATWVERTPPTNLISLDPILYTDRVTGRTIVSQLISDATVFAAGCSLSAYTDDDGQSWTPAEGCGPPAGADHQSIGGGPYHQPMTLPLPLYADAVYYCAQSVGAVIGDATCSRSDDGGFTYGPGVVIYTSECGGLHGHPRVGPDGTVYLPNKDCVGGDTGLGQGVVISEDNGLSWRVSVVPGTTPGESDPSVATGLNDSGKPADQASNTVYLGMCDGDGHPKVAVSHDVGATWTDVNDVGQAAHIANCVFPEMIAGDDNRASMFFLGTPVDGPFQSADFKGEWHAYIATTYDGGKSWGLADATPDDPVQIGCIWMQGGSSPCRNLLDFNDITLDKEGRPLFVFADGCLPENDCRPGASPDTSRSAVDSIGRQSSCLTLFSAADKTVGALGACGGIASPPASHHTHSMSEGNNVLGAMPPALLGLAAALALLRRRARGRKD